MIDSNNVSFNELYHYGVPGMKWGRRKAYDPTSRGGSITKMENIELVMVSLLLDLKMPEPQSEVIKFNCDAFE